MSQIIVTEELTKTYNGKPAVTDLTISLPEGRVSGLLGPNGSGKSTLLKMITGLARPDSGSVSVFGGAPSWRANADIAYLPDRAKWYGRHTVGHAVEFAGCVYPRFNKDRARELLTGMKLDPASPVDSLSRGHQACLMLALCLAREARLVLLDEPFSGIDLVSRERIIRGIIDSLATKSQTFVISTHEIYEAESLFEYVAFMSSGRLLSAGEADGMRSQYGSIESNYRRLYQ